MRKLKYCVDCSLDGFIARQDHSYDFLPSEGEHINDFLELIKQYDIAHMGCVRLPASWRRARGVSHR